ncbi:MAG: zinc ribbon domain-containing protein [Chloroflexota bacterium]
MDFLEDLFDFGDRKRRNKGGFFQNGDHHDDDHHDDHDYHPNQGNIYPQVSMNSPIPGNQPFSTVPAASLPGVVCRNCSTQTVQGAKFCHGCGTAIEVIQTCASCGSKLPARALFCAQCGYKNG